MRTASGSRRWVVKRDWPGRRRSSSAWISASSRGMRGGTPSMTTPIAGPWLSPQVVKRNKFPKLLPAMAPSADSSSALLARAGTGQAGQKLRRRRRIVHRDHADGMVPGIDMMDLAGHARAQVAQQVEGGVADFLGADIALKRRVQLVPFQDIAEIADAAGRQGLDRSGRNGVDPDLLRAEVGREVADAGL